MILSWLQQLDGQVRRALPFLVTLAFVLFSAAAPPLPDFAALTPSFALIAVYYWSVHRPDLLDYPALFLLGLLLDGLLRLPFGLSALGFMLVARWVRQQRSVFTAGSYVILWLGFAVAAAMMAGLCWAALSLIAWHLLPLKPLGMQTMLTIAVFPVFAWILILLQRYIVR